MSAPSWLRWTLLALLGLAIAAGVSVAASHLVSQRIGLASEPLTAGRALAPPPRERSNDHGRRGIRPRGTSPTTTTTTTTVAPPTATTTPPATSTTTAPAPPPASPAPPRSSDGSAEHQGDD
jgi:hypothetical protein